MLKNILKLNGAQQLSKNEQQSINGSGGKGCFQGCDSGFLGLGSICSTDGGCHNGHCTLGANGLVCAIV